MNESNPTLEGFPDFLTTFMASRFTNFNDKPVPIEAEIPTYSNRMLENKSKSSASKF
jgi:hypothetical protein